jgi:hypothetical protein
MQYRCAKFIATRYLQSAGERNVIFKGKNMPQVNSTYIETLKDAFKHTRFSYKDFTFNFPDSGKVLTHIEFKHQKNLTFQITEEVEVETITERDKFASVIGGTSERKNKSIVNYAIFSPGQYKKTDKLSLYELSNASDHIASWCRYIFAEISLKKQEDTTFDQLREQIEEQLKNNGVNENEPFSDEELVKINSKFDELLRNFEQLKEESKITQAELNSVKMNLKSLKNPPRLCPKAFGLELQTIDSLI